MEFLDVVAKYAEHPELDPGPNPVATIGYAEDEWRLAVILFATDPKGEQLKLRITVPLALDHEPTATEMRLRGQPILGLRKLGPGVYKPWGQALQLTRHQACYVTVTECPEPAPWEKSSLLVH